MNRETLFDALAGIDDRFIAEALRYSPEAASGSSERIVHLKKKRIISFALAAALILALGVTAWAVFSTYSVRVPEPDEGFRINWEENASGYIEWTDAKLAVTFPETAESREIEFRPGWLPAELPSQLPGSFPWDGLDSGTWFSRLSFEGLADSFPNMTASNQPLLIETYYMSMFNDGGALLLLYYTPEDIIEDHWDEQNVDVMRFHATQHLEANAYAPERTLEQDILLMSDPDAGWVVCLRSGIGMDELVKVAKNLEIRETGKEFSYDDFEDHYTFMDGGVG
ncbi:MAG: hypothetical protein IJP64_02895 [Oscillospiraceae bacterium]|nr:hypothetical protein [Oscillospiraceae bacterium]